jgi:GxxExxY protein
MQYEQLTRSVIGCAYRVYNTLGYGFLESVYRRSMVIELEREGHAVVSEAAIEVMYGDAPVGVFKADLLVEQEVIVELKSTAGLVVANELQLVNYLTATGKDVGLLLNFGPSCVEVRRKVRRLQRIVDACDPQPSR